MFFVLFQFVWGMHLQEIDLLPKYSLSAPTTYFLLPLSFFSLWLEISDCPLIDVSGAAWLGYSFRCANIFCLDMNCA